MKRKLFKYKFVSSKSDKAIGIMFRLIGIDFAIIFMGYFTDWKLIDLRIPNNFGFYCQLLFAFVAVGILKEDMIYERAF